MSGIATHHSSWVGSGQYPVAVFSAITRTTVATSEEAQGLQQVWVGFAQ